MTSGRYLFVVRVGLIYGLAHPWLPCAVGGSSRIPGPDVVSDLDKAPGSVVYLVGQWLPR